MSCIRSQHSILFCVLTAFIGLALATPAAAQYPWQGEKGICDWEFISGPRQGQKGDAIVQDLFQGYGGVRYGQHKNWYRNGGTWFVNALLYGYRSPHTVQVINGPRCRYQVNGSRATYDNCDNGATQTCSRLGDTLAIAATVLGCGCTDDPGFALADCYRSCAASKGRPTPNFARALLCLVVKANGLPGGGAGGGPFGECSDDGLCASPLECNNGNCELPNPPL